MNLKYSANGMNTLTDLAPLSSGAGGLLVAGVGADEQLADQEELDDDVEALIVSMDGTTAEHLFLSAQRRVR